MQRGAPVPQLRNHDLSRTHEVDATTVPQDWYIVKGWSPFLPHPILLNVSPSLWAMILKVLCLSGAKNMWQGENVLLQMQQCLGGERQGCDFLSVLLFSPLFSTPSFDFPAL